MISRDPPSCAPCQGNARLPPPEVTPVPFPVFTDSSRDGKRGFVQFWPERDCVGALLFFRAIDPGAHARWWVREILSRTATQREYPKDLHVRDDLEKSISRPDLRKRVLATLSVVPESEHLREAIRHFGYVEDAESGNFVRTTTPVFKYASSVKLSERLGESRETLERIPELYDPEIFFEHPATQSPFSSRERMRAEGEQDAACARLYLSAYRRFMESPNVANIVAATIHPFFGDSYNLAMGYCLKNNVSEDFISLLHVVFAVQWVIESRPLSASIAPAESQGLFREDVELLRGIVRHYCLQD